MIMPTRTARIVSAALLSATLSAAVVAGPALAGPAATFTGRDLPSCQQVWDAMPDPLRDDIAAAVGLDQSQQHRALRAIRLAALRGAYGEQVRTRAVEVRERRVELWQSFPATLKADVRAARSLPAREQRRAMYAIRYAALQGTYGDRVEQLAEDRRAWLRGCPTPAGAFESNDGLAIG